MPGMTGGGGGAGPARKDPLISAHYYVTVDPHLSGMVFRECSGIGSESEVVEYKGTKQEDYHTIQAIPGRLKWMKINLKRGITDTLEAWTWRKMVEEGNVEGARASGTIVMVNQNGDPVAEWTFDRGWPSKISGPQLNSGQNDVGVEELEIVHEGLRRVR